MSKYIKSVFIDTTGQAIPIGIVRKDIYAVLSGIEIPKNGDDLVNTDLDEYVVPKVVARLQKKNWSGPSIELITGELGGLIKTVPGKTRGRRVIKVKPGFKSTLEELVKAG